MDFLDRRWLQVGEGFPRLQVATSRTWIPWIVSGYEWVMDPLDCKWLVVRNSWFTYKRV